MKILTIMSILFCAQVVGGQTLATAQIQIQTPAPTPIPDYPSDTIRTREGGELKITFFGHASIAFDYGGKRIYVDPVSDFADYTGLPKADLILVGHEHGDHLDPRAIEAVWQPETFVVGNPTAIEALGRGTVAAHGEVNGLALKPFSVEGKEVPMIEFEAFPAYNTSPSQLGFHPRERLHNGWLLTFGGTRVYVAGDTEDTPELLALREIDIAFLPVNQPYTMTEEQSARVVLAIRPAIFYPYHYGQTDHTTDLSKLEKLLDGSGVEVRIRPLE